MSGIGQTWCSRVGDNRDSFAGFCLGNQFRCTPFFIVIVERDERFLNFQMVEKFARMARVFARDQVDCSQGLDCAKGDVAQVSDGGGDEGDEGSGVGLIGHESGIGRESAGRRSKVGRVLRKANEGMFEH